MLIMVCPGCLTRRVHKIGTLPDSIATSGDQEVWQCEVGECGIHFWPSRNL